MVSKLEMEQCFAAARKLIQSIPDNKQASEEQTNEMIEMSVFLLQGTIECLFRIADSLEEQVKLQTEIHRFRMELTAKEQADDGSTKG